MVHCYGLTKRYPLVLSTGIYFGLGTHMVVLLYTTKTMSVLFISTTGHTLSCIRRTMARDVGGRGPRPQGNLSGHGINRTVKSHSQLPHF